jgi:hypothetical protein
MNRMSYHTPYLTEHFGTTGQKHSSKKCLRVGTFLQFALGKSLIVLVMGLINKKHFIYIWTMHTKQNRTNSDIK